MATKARTGRRRTAAQFVSGAPLIPLDIEGVDALVDLALDLRWSWDHAAEELWGRLEPDVWTMTRNPWLVLLTAGRGRIEELALDADFRERLETYVALRRAADERPTWFATAHAGAKLRAVAYFSMEFMLREALPIYSGGLGNVAGDQLKAASDLGVPVVGVGLLYQRGYFRQVIAEDGTQHAVYPPNDPMQLPISPVRDANGHWVRVELSFAGRRVRLRAWQARVGRTTLYLLDSNDPSNEPADRGITSDLYGGGPEVRLAQELALGVGGWRLLDALGIDADVCHLNEGHAAFAVLERARSFAARSGQPFDVGLAATRAGNLFTTHTPVAAGFDRFAPDLVGRYVGRYAREELGIGLDDVLALGRERPDDPTEPFNMAYLAIRGSAAVNAVSRLHGEVSRRLFQPLFERWPAAEVPIGHVSNGVHVPSWDSDEAEVIWTKACGTERWRGAEDDLDQGFAAVTDEELWNMRAEARMHLVAYARERLRRQVVANGVDADTAAWTGSVFDPNVLTIGFARRFAAYKRPNLLLHDPERLARLLTHRERPVQLMVAGKAHPADGDGHDLIAQWTRFAARPDVRARVAFLADHDMLLTEHLVRGVDLWVNTPRRPWEASGTSGMKILANGGLNVSELDGWWAEAYAPGLGWALGDGREHDGDPAWDAAEAGALYRLLEEEITPAFYDRDAHGVPVGWVARVRQSMLQLTPRFSADRAVREYTQRYYLDTAAAYRRRASADGAAAAALRGWTRDLDRHWHDLHVADASFGVEQGTLSVRVPVYLGELAPDAVAVEVYADPANGCATERHVLEPLEPLAGAVNGVLYGAELAVTRPPSDYTIRVVPWHPDASIPLEAARIAWHPLTQSSADRPAHGQ
jgi:starch phosphorylase